MLVTRHPDNFIGNELASYINLGSSTRGAIAFMQCAKALALISLNFSAIADNITVEQIIDAVFGAIPTP